MSIPGIFEGYVFVFLHERNTICLWNDGLFISHPSAILQRPPTPYPGLPRPLQCGSVLLDRPQTVLDHSLFLSFIHVLTHPFVYLPGLITGSWDLYLQKGQCIRGHKQVGRKCGPCLTRALTASARTVMGAKGSGGNSDRELVRAGHQEQARWRVGRN